MGKVRLTQIDGLRGLAALTVMVGHWAEFVASQNAPAAMQAGIQALFLDDFSFGRLGIVAFFCVSGFVVPFSFRGKRPLLSFPLSRIFRLYPAYWASIALAVVLFPVLDGGVFGPIRIVSNLTMIQTLLGQDHIIDVYWTLFVELIFYFICYVMFMGRVLDKAWANMVAMCVFIGVALIGGAYRWIHPESDLPVGVPTYLAAMHFGTLARLHFMNRGQASPTFYRLGLAVLLAGVTAANTLAYFRAENELTGWVASDLGFIAGVTLFILCIERGWFGGRTLPFLGLISYSMYLIHVITITAIAHVWPDGLGWSGATAAVTIPFFAATIAAAILMHRWIERPGITLGRQLDAAFNAALDYRAHKI